MLFPFRVEIVEKYLEIKSTVEVSVGVFAQVLAGGGGKKIIKINRALFGIQLSLVYSLCYINNFPCFSLEKRNDQKRRREHREMFTVSFQ